MAEQCTATWTSPQTNETVGCDRPAGHAGSHWEVVPGTGRRWTDNAHGATPHRPTTSLADEVMMADDPEVELRRDHVARIDELERELAASRWTAGNYANMLGRVVKERDRAIAERDEALAELASTREETVTNLMMVANQLSEERDQLKIDLQEANRAYSRVSATRGRLEQAIQGARKILCDVPLF